MSSALLLACLLLTGSQSGSDKGGPRKPHPFAPSLPALTEEEEDKLDSIVDRFILQDTGRLIGEEGKKARLDFDRLGPESVFALIRGLNKAAAIDHSCPAVVIGKKLARMISSTTDTELLEFARENVGAGVTRSRHMNVIKDLRTMAMLRKAQVVRLGLDNTTVIARGPTIKELSEAIGRETGDKLRKAILELGKRSGDDALTALAAAVAGTSDKDLQQLAREQLQKQLAVLPSTALKEKLKDERAEIRAAAVKASERKKPPLGGEWIDLLADDNAEVRTAAHQALVRLNGGKDLGPRADATESERTLAAKEWRAWWDKQGGR
jgi:hypothetical protein